MRERAKGHLPYDIKVSGENIKEGKGDLNWGRKKDLKEMGVGKNVKL